MAVWMVRAGRNGEREELALSDGVAVIGWDELPDLSSAQSREDIEDLLKEHHPDAKPKTLMNWATQVWTFVGRVMPDDLVVLPLKMRSAIAVGRASGEYEYRPQNPPGAHHVRRVEWTRDDIPRTAFDQDLLYSMGAFLTVCQIKRNNAEEHIRAVAEGKPAPPAGTPSDVSVDEDASRSSTSEPSPRTRFEPSLASTSRVTTCPGLSMRSSRCRDTGRSCRAPARTEAWTSLAGRAPWDLRHRGWWCK